MKKRNVYITDPEIQKKVSSWPELKMIYTGCEFIAGTGWDGELHYYSNTYLRYGYREKVIMLAPDKHHTAVVFGLKEDGTCVVGKAPFAGWNSYGREYSDTVIGNDFYGSLLFGVHSLKDIVQIAVNGSLLLALDGSGKVHTKQYVSNRHSLDDDKVRFIRAINDWENVRRILLAEQDIIIAQKHSGELVCAGYTQDLFGTYGEKAFRKLQDKELADACAFYGGESMYFAFLDSEGKLYSSRRGTEEARFTQLEGLDHAFLGLREDGQVVSFQGGLEDRIRKWPKMKMISLGRRTRGHYDDLLLSGLPVNGA